MNESKGLKREEGSAPPALSPFSGKDSLVERWMVVRCVERPGIGCRGSKGEDEDKKKKEGRRYAGCPAAMWRELPWLVSTAP